MPPIGRGARSAGAALLFGPWRGAHSESTCPSSWTTVKPTQPRFLVGSLSGAQPIPGRGVEPTVAPIPVHQQYSVVPILHTGPDTVTISGLPSDCELAV
jgi:hypothetical protein